MLASCRTAIVAGVSGHGCGRGDRRWAPRAGRSGRRPGGGSRDLIERRQAEEALAAFDKAAAAFWRLSPLQLRTALFADSVAGFGNTRRAPTPRSTPGETATVYLEPFGYGFAEDGDVPRRVRADLRNPHAGRPDPRQGRRLRRSRMERPGEEPRSPCAGRIDLPDLKPGSYELLLTLADKASPKTTTATLPFSSSIGGRAVADRVGSPRPIARCAGAVMSLPMAVKAASRRAVGSSTGRPSFVSLAQAVSMSRVA